MQSSATTSQLKTQIACLSLLILLPCILYFNSLQGAFQYDDRDLLEQSWIADLSSFEKNVRLEDFHNRPVLLFTYALNNDWHKNQAFGFHLLNLQIHLLVTVLVFVILVRSQQLLALDSGKDPSVASGNKLFPLAAALIFALHPLNTDSVAYISSRSTLLASFFYLFTLWLFLEFFNPGRKKLNGALQIILALMIAIAAFLAIASKLIAVTLPAILLLWFLAFVCPGQFPHLRAFILNRKKIPFYLGAGALILALIFYKPELLYNPLDQGAELFGAIPYFFIQTKVVIFYYLKLFFFPINLNVDNGFPFSSFFSDFRIPLSILLIIGILARAATSGKTWLIAGTLWFFITLSPTSTVIPLSDLAVEHRTYLPISLGLCLVAGWWLCGLSRRWRAGLIVLILATFSTLTIARNNAWISEISLWKDSVKKNPLSARGHNNLGKAYHEAQQLDQAVLHLEKSVELMPRFISRQYNLDNPEQFLQRFSERNNNLPSSGDHLMSLNLVEPHYNLASAYLDRNQFDGAQKEYETALRLKPDHFAAHLGLGTVYSRTQNFAKAETHYRLALQYRQQATGAADYPLARLNLGELYGRMGNLEKAIAELTLAVRHDPSLMLAHYNLGTAQMMLNHAPEAERAFKASLELNPDFEPAIFNLAKVLQSQKQWAQSTQWFEQFIKLKGPHSRVFFEIGNNHKEENRYDEAVKFYRMALQMNPPPEQVLALEKLINELSAP